MENCKYCATHLRIVYSCNILYLKNVKILSQTVFMHTVDSYLPHIFFTVQPSLKVSCLLLEPAVTWSNFFIFSTTPAMQQLLWILITMGKMRLSLKYMGTLLYWNAGLLNQPVLQFWRINMVKLLVLASLIVGRVLQLQVAFLGWSCWHQFINFWSCFYSNRPCYLL